MTSFLIFACGLAAGVVIGMAIMCALRAPLEVTEDQKHADDLREKLDAQQREGFKNDRS